MLNKRERQLINVYRKLYDILQTHLSFILSLINNDIRKELKKNSKLKGLYKNERCFIIGNAPSLKYQDLSKLANEYVFTVNSLVKSPLFSVVNPSFHFFADPEFFINDNAILKQLLVDKNNLNLFIPYVYKKSFLTSMPSLRAHTYTFYYKKSQANKIIKTIDLSKGIPSFLNVILYAIYVAIYMGFNEIYLLGVDMTGFLLHYELNKINDKYAHVYQETKKEHKKNINRIKERGLDNEFYLKAFGRTFEQFKIINSYCEKNNIKLRNATHGGALDCIQRVNFESLKF